MSAEIKEMNLDEVYEFSSGLSKPRSEFGSGYGFLSFKDVFYNYFVPERLTELVNSTAKERVSCSIKRGDVFLTRTSETMDELGMSCVALKDYPDATFNGFTKRLRPKDPSLIVPEYAAYYFRSPSFRSTVTAMSTLSTRASLNNEMLSRLKIVFPNTQQQEKISSILKCLDDKIVLNRQIIQTLEQIAQTIFKSWFVDFAPVKAKIEAKAAGRDPERAAMCAISGKSEPELEQLSPEQYQQLATTAALFPDELVESELGLIPKGWEVCPLGNKLEVKRGGSPRPIQNFIVKAGLPWVKIADATAVDGPFLFKTKEFIKPEGLSKTILLKKGSLILSNSATPGLPKFLELDACIHDGWLYFLKKKLFSDTYLYHLFLKLRTELVAQGNGSVFTNLKTDILRNQLVVAPPAKIISKFDDVVVPLLNMNRAICIETANLSEIRDTLLPKLLSGELTVGECEREMISGG